jgi:hypothetical protein
MNSLWLSNIHNGLLEFNFQTHLNSNILPHKILGREFTPSTLLPISDYLRDLKTGRFDPNLFGPRVKTDHESRVSTDETIRVRAVQN